MASRPHLLIRILQAVIHRLWTVLFFLMTLSLLGLAQHFWPYLLRAGLTVQTWIAAGLHFFRN